MTGHQSAAMKRVNPPDLGVPPGYSQVVKVRGGLIIFIADQTALDRNSDVVGKADFARKLAQVFENLTVALRSVGCTATNLMKCRGSTVRISFEAIAAA
jgi:enamine deaminase RidA (YjgF/YER057c/UK114 family)